MLVDYKQTLEFLFAQLPMFQRIGPAAYKADLTNTIALCEYLGNPQHKFRSIHVAGTNGKGSVSHMLAAICQASGMRTGLYVSPHYKDFRERIKINGQYIPRKAVVQFVAQHREAIERIQPSFFELGVAMAFDFFAREKVDIAVIEVGLGGRLDSTNVITPLLSVITNISFDHQTLLGDTLPLIASEKAGIIKPKIPVVIGETHPESAPVFIKKAAELEAPITFADQHFKVLESDAEAPFGTSIYHVFKDGISFLPNLELDASGPFQSKNLVTVIQSYETLIQTYPNQFVENQGVLRDGLKRIRSYTRFMGRWQMLGEHPSILCDSAHNEAGLRLAFEDILKLFEALKRKADGSKLHLVTGFVKDKEVEKGLQLFPKEARYYFAKANIPRGMEAVELMGIAAQFGLYGRAYSSVRNAFKGAKRAASPQDLIVVIGSIFVVGEVLPGP